jgi:hypothetical protein
MFRGPAGKQLLPGVVEPSMVEKPPDPGELGFYFSLAQVGIEMVVPPVGGLLVDNYLGTRPWGVAAGAVLGFAVGILHLVAILHQRDKKDTSNQEQDSQ